MAASLALGGGGGSGNYGCLGNHGDLKGLAGTCSCLTLGEFYCRGSQVGVTGVVDLLLHVIEVGVAEGVGIHVLY